MNVEALNKSFKASARATANKRRLPNSIEEADLVQEAWIVALEQGHKYTDDGRATLATFLKKPLTWRFAECIAASHYGPSTSVRHWRRKKGLPVNYGEVSFEVLGMLDGVPWIETIAADDSETVHLTIKPEEAKACIADIEAQLAAGNDAGISFAKSRGKHHVQVVICGRQQFVGQFIKIEEARARKVEFLRAFLEVVIDAVEVA